MLDVFHDAGETPTGNGLKLLSDFRHLLAVFPLGTKKMQARRLQRHVAKLAEQIGPVAAIDGDVSYVGEINLSFLQAVMDGLRWESRPVLDPAKPLLFCCGEQFAMPHDASRRIRVVGIDAQD